MGQILLLGYLIVLSVFDSRECKVPIVLVCGGFLGALICVLSRCMSSPDEWKWFVFAMVLGGVPGIFMLGLSGITGNVGFGDGLVLLVVGMLVGYKDCLILIGFSLLLMSLWCIGVLCCKKGNRNTRVPYLPFLTAIYITRLLV